MATPRRRGFGLRVWAGDQSTVTEARGRYGADPERWLLEYAMALYTFRHMRTHALNLVALYEPLSMRAVQEMEASCTDAEARDVARRADQLATYLEWMSRSPLLPEDRYRNAAAHLAQKVCEHGERCVESYHPFFRDHHTPLLLWLTHARLLLSAGEVARADILLDRIVERNPGRIQDTNQRVRVYRKLSLLSFQRGAYRRWFSFGLKALAQSSTRAERLKSLAAFLGTDR